MTSAPPCAKTVSLPAPARCCQRQNHDRVSIADPVTVVATPFGFNYETRCTGRCWQIDKSTPDWSVNTASFWFVPLFLVGYPRWSLNDGNCMSTTTCNSLISKLSPLLRSVILQPRYHHQWWTGHCHHISDALQIVPTSAPVEMVSPAPPISLSTICSCLEPLMTVTEDLKAEASTVNTSSDEPTASVRSMVVIPAAWALVPSVKERSVVRYSQQGSQ